MENHPSANKINGPLEQLVYISRASHLFSEEELLKLLESARPKNESKDITGMLLYKDMSFIQLLEGPEQEVAAVFSEIKKDKRHSRVQVLVQEPLNQRTFINWSMGFHNLDQAPIQDIEGYTNYIRTEEAIEELITNPSPILQLLQYFRSRS